MHSNIIQVLFKAWNLLGCYQELSSQFYKDSIQGQNNITMGKYLIDPINHKPILSATHIQSLSSLSYRD